MPRAKQSVAKRSRISLEVEPGLRRRVRLASAKCNMSVRQYITDALQERLREELEEEDDRVVALTVRSDPVLAALWDNDKDAAYDRIVSDETWS